MEYFLSVLWYSNNTMHVAVTLVEFSMEKIAFQRSQSLKVSGGSFQRNFLVPMGKNNYHLPSPREHEATYPHGPAVLPSLLFGSLLSLTLSDIDLLLSEKQMKLIENLNTFPRAAAHCSKVDIGNGRTSVTLLED